MIIIGEKINGSIQVVAKAIKKKKENKMLKIVIV